MDKPIKVFYSYSHKDDALRERLAAHLAILERQDLIEDWHHRKIAAGEDWAREIHQRLESAEVILLLISANFLASSYCYELEMTRALERHAAGEARVIPIILRPSDWRQAPFADLQALPEGGKPVASWRNRDAAFAEITAGVRAVAEELRRSPERRRRPTTAGEPPRPPEGPGGGLPVLLETGAMPADSPFYISRGELRRAAERLESTDPTVLVKGYRQSGKSSLLTRLHIGALEKGRKSCYLNFQDLDESSFDSPKRLFLELGRMMSDELEIAADPDDHWSDRRSPKPNLTSFVEKAILATSEAPLQLLFDEVDMVFDFPESRQSLFSMLRAWHNRRARDAKGRWRRLRMVIAHATDPGLWIRDPTQSPFNVGLPITLEDFDLRQAQDLNRRQGEPLDGGTEVPRLMDLVGGHPYLLRLALYTLLRQERSLAELERVATRETGPFAAHLRRYLALLLDRQDLRSSLRQILDEGVCTDEMHFHRLSAAGLIRGETPDDVEMRCRLYRDYFGSRL